MIKVQLSQNPFDHYPEMIVHPVNCQALGRDAFSKRIKRIFPEYFRSYTQQILRKKLTCGVPVVVELDSLFGTRFCVTFPIQDHWRTAVNPAQVKELFVVWKNSVAQHEIKSIGLPEFEGPPKGWLSEHLKTLFSDIPWDIDVFVFPKPESEISANSIEPQE